MIHNGKGFSGGPWGSSSGTHIPVQPVNLPDMERRFFVFPDPMGGSNHMTERQTAEPKTLVKSFDDT